jgi:hypothetical protein
MLPQMFSFPGEGVENWYWKLDSRAIRLKGGNWIKTYLWWANFVSQCRNRNLTLAITRSWLERPNFWKRGLNANSTSSSLFNNSILLKKLSRDRWWYPQMKVQSKEKNSKRKHIFCCFGQQVIGNSASATEAVRKGHSGNWNRDLSHPKRESYH